MQSTDGLRTPDTFCNLDPISKKFEDFGPKEMKDVDSEVGLRDNPSHWTVC